MRLSAACASLILLHLSSGSAEQQPAVVTLQGKGVVFPEQFTNINAIDELSDHRVVVADPCEKRVYILDFTTGRKTAAGREGTGPGEYQLPLTVLPYPGDTTLVLDIGGQKFVRVVANGQILAVPPTNYSVAESGSLMFSFRTRVHVDSLGRIYSGGNTTVQRPGQPRRPVDSVAIMRFDPRAGTLDTVAFHEADRQSGTGISMGGRTGAPPRVTAAANDTVHPFRASKRWLVLPDGSIAFIAPEPFTMQLLAPTGRRGGAIALAHQPIRVTDADRANYFKIDSTRGGCNMTVSQPTGNGVLFGATRTTMPRGSSWTPPPAKWPEFKHPYDDDEKSVMISSFGTMLVRTARAANDSIPNYDEFDRQGRLVRHLRLPPNTRLLALTRMYAYVSRNDADGLQHISRYPIN